MPRDANLLDQDFTSRITAIKTQLQNELDRIKEERDAIQNDYNDLQRQLHLIQAQIQQSGVEKQVQVQQDR